MAEEPPAARPTPAWMFVNEVRVVVIVLGAAIVVLAIGMTLFLLTGTDQLDTVDVFLGTGVFFLLFTLLLFVPRLRTRGAMSFSLLVEHPLEDVEMAVTGAVEDAGRKARVEVLRARYQRPPREVLIEGLSWRFALRAAPYRERREDGTQWTEIVQAGLQNQEDEVARELRERVLSRLATSG